MGIPRENTLRLASAVLALLGVGVATYIVIADSGGARLPAWLAVAGARRSHPAPTRI
jgi:hypothetical protein